MGDTIINRATKAALLSAFLFPGSGQIFLKKYNHGVPLIILTVAGIGCLCWYLVNVVQEVLKSGPITSPKSFNLFHFLLIIFFIVLIWLYSIFEAYWLGKKEMMRSTANVRQ